MKDRAGYAIRYARKKDSSLLPYAQCVAERPNKILRRPQPKIYTLLCARVNSLILLS